MWLPGHLFTIFLVTLLSLSSSSIGANKILNFKDLYLPHWTNNDTQYISSTSYDAKGMAPLYDISNQILKIFTGDTPIPEGYIIVTEQNVQPGPKVENSEWGPLLQQYWGVLLVVAICAVIIALMPIIGFCFCCCRCAGACGGRSQPFDKKHDTCRRVMLGLFLICAATGLIFGVVVAFVTNSYMHQGVENATTTARYGVDDTRKFLKSTSVQANHLLVNNYDVLSRHLKEMLEDTSNVVIDQLEEQSKAISLTQLATFVTALPKIKGDLSRMKEIINGLRVNASQLSDGLRGVKRILLVSLTKCKTEACRNVLEEYQIGKLDVNGIDYNQLPDVTSFIDSIDNLISNADIDAIKQGEHVLEDLRSKIRQSIQENIPKVTDAIDDAGNGIKNASNEITKTFEQISDFTGNNTYKHLDTADFYIQEHLKYSYYTGIAISSCLLLILLCVVMGLFCGICGKRPDGYGDDCCNKGSGSRFLMFGVAIIFLTISILTAVALIYFLAGLLLRRGVCVPLKNPENDQIFEYVDRFIDLNSFLYPRGGMSRRTGGRARVLPKDGHPLHISDVIASCHGNNSIYEVLELKNYFNIEDIREYPVRYGIDSKLAELINSIQIEPNIEILSAEAVEAMKHLSESELKNFESYKFIDNLNEQITQYNLNVIADKLIETADKISNNPEMNEVKTSLKNQALHLRTYQDNLVTPMTDQTREITNLAVSLHTTLSFNRSSFEEALQVFQEEIKQAQDFINVNGTAFVRQVAQELVTTFKGDITTYLNDVVSNTQNDLGRCGPLSNVYNSTIVAVCNRVVDPFNGFWTGVAWCIFIFLPAIILSVKLSTLYQKSDPYPGPLVESEYMYDAYSERDNIPLANGPKNKRKKKHERRRSSRDRRGDYYEDSSSPHGPSSGPRDARYNDMAPKHWENGPPRYQNPPIAPPASEYERPPPYYFPGAPSEPE